MSGAVVTAGAVQLLGGVALSPLLVGSIQTMKARLQGRRGAAALQPYRELRRLWRKSAVSPSGTTVVYRAAPAIAAAAVFAAVLLVPVGARSPEWPVGHDALVLAGLLALSRFALTLAAWDTGNGFALQGASRDLMISICTEAVLVLSLAAAALAAGSTDLRAITAALSGTNAWATPAAPLAALAYLSVIFVETGRQPIDNPDTHLELTMVHEGMLLEYAGRDLAYLHWGMAARHWVVLSLAAALFVPHPQSFAAQVALLPAVLAALCVMLALAETVIVKMRILLVPRLLGVSAGVALLAVVTELTRLSA
jgi:formate hydrogenlyase subunit 4